VNVELCVCKPLVQREQIYIEKEIDKDGKMRKLLPKYAE